MGVLNFPGSLYEQNGIEFDIISLEADIELQHDMNEVALQNINLSNSEQRVNKRKRTTKCSQNRKSYDFRDLGVDARRRGAKHQRRKQNLTDLLDTVDSNVDQLANNNEEAADWYSEDHLTLFTELFLDEKKMKAWERFVNMPEEKQKEYLEHKTGVKRSKVSEHVGGTEVSEERDGDVSMACEKEKNGFHMIDKKIRDMLRTKKLAGLGLLEYFEDDVRSCVEETFPAVLVLNLDSGYDRLLVYAICQYMKLSSSTIRLKDNAASLIEIDLPTSQDGHWRLPEIKLTDYLKRMRK